MDLKDCVPKDVWMVDRMLGYEIEVIDRMKRIIDRNSRDLTAIKRLKAIGDKEIGWALEHYRAYVRRCLEATDGQW